MKTSDSREQKEKKALQNQLVLNWRNSIEATQQNNSHEAFEISFKRYKKKVLENGARSTGL